MSNSLTNRAAWRHALLTTPDLDKYISGVILTEETFYQPLDTTRINDNDSASTGTSNSNSNSGSSTSHSTGPRLVEALVARGVAVGVKVDLGTAPLNPEDPGPSFEFQTNGLEGLAHRCQQYAADGATFTKWRAVLRIDEARGWPTAEAVAVNAQQLAQYAAVAQAAGLVPIVEPEVMVMEGDHGIEVSEAVSVKVLSAVVHALLERGVLLEGVVLKPAMVLPGSSTRSTSSSTASSATSSTASGTASSTSSADEVAAATLRVLRRTVPPALPGIAFLSGGQGEMQAAQHLAAMNAACTVHEHASDGTPAIVDSGCSCQPWVLTFSFGRALQASALQAWARDPTDVAAVQQAFSGVAAVAADAASRAPLVTAAAAAAA
jgi:fructose-bisphosphate aldolase class I